MKKVKIKLTAILILGVSFQLCSQIFVGGKIGFAQSNATVSGINPSLTPDIHSLNAFTAGLTTEISLDKYLSLLTGVSYGKKGFNIHESTDVNILGLNVPIGAKIETRASFVELPIHLKYSIGNSKVKGFISTGPSFSYGTSGRIATYASTFIDFGITDQEIDFSNDRYNRLLLSGDIKLGADITYGMGKITTAVTYSKGFNKFLTDNTINVNLTPQALAFDIGYAVAF
jgi:hypothetical protein